MKKIGIIFIGIMFFLPFKSGSETLDLAHPYWRQTVEVKDGVFCKDANRTDCANIKYLDDKTLIVFWKRWAAEKFIYDEYTESWRFAEKYNNALEAAYHEFEYTFEEPYVAINPYQKAPLVAVVKFPTEKKSRISIRVKGKEGSPDITHTFKDFNIEHEIPVFGLYPNYENKVVLTATTEDGATKESVITIKMGNVSLNHQWIMTNKKDDSFNYYAGYDGWVYDEKGDLRYFFDAAGWGNVQYFKNHAYIEYPNQIKKFTLIGKEVKVYTYPKGFWGYVHGFGFKPNGNLLVFGTFEGTKALIDGEKRETHRDQLIEFDGQTGKVINQYDLAEMINPDRSLIIKSSFIDYGKVDWAHTNGIDYDEKNKAILVSGRHFGVLKISEKTKKPIWWLTPHQLTHKSGRKGKNGDVSHLLLTAIDKNGKPYSKAVQQGIEKTADFKWPLKTHSVKYIGNGAISIFDNSGEMYDKKLYTTENSVASVFEIDDKKKTIKQTFLKELPHYSDMGSSVIIHPQTKQYWVMASNVVNSNHTKMRDGHIQRFDKDGNELYHAVIHLETNGWIYLVQPYEFYSDNNWPTPQE